jgi:hypothetical protein
MKFVFEPNFVAVSTCSLDFLKHSFNLLLPAPLSGLFFIRVQALTLQRCCLPGRGYMLST